jgi:hypothetical protein
VSGRLWTVHDYEQLFGQFPEDGPPLSTTQATGLAQQTNRKVDAILWQWEDGASYVSGRSASTTSLALKAWLDRRSDRR